MSSIGAAAGIETGGAGAVASGFGDMKSEDFVRIIFTELQNQDPFDPNDSAALLDQLNSIRSIESDMKLTSQLESIVFQNQLSSASNMIGRFVSGLADGGLRVEGQVISVVRQGDRIGLELDTGWVLDLENVELIVDQSIFGGGNNNGSSGPVTGVPDLNGDGEINGVDLAMLLGQWSEDNNSSDGDSDGGDSDSDGDDAP